MQNAMTVLAETVDRLWALDFEARAQIIQMLNKLHETRGGAKFKLLGTTTVDAADVEPVVGDGGDELISLEKAAKIAKISKQAAYRARKAGHLPAVRNGKAYQVRLSDAMAYRKSLRD